MESNCHRFDDVFDGWKVTRKLGQGSVGQVYEIGREQDGISSRSALKFICIPKDPDEIKFVLSGGTRKEDLPAYYKKVKDDYIQEFRCMSKMKESRNIVRYEEHKTVQHEDGIGWDIFMRMELLTPLIDYALDHELTEDDVIRLGIDISNALIVCGKQGIMHRDIKPDNIFVDGEGNFKLGDFGVARIIEETQMSMSHKGTIAYMAPELYRGEDYGMSADIYSLGLVLYKYLNNGRLPFMPKYPEQVDYSDSEKALVKRVRRDTVPAPLNGSDALKEIVLKACSGEASNRFQSGEELKAALEELQGEKRASAVIIKKHPEVAKKSLKLLIALVVLITCCAAGVWASIPKEVTDISGINERVSLYIGDSLSPEYRVLPDRFKDEEISFESDDTDVFKVTENGTIKALSCGRANLRLTAKEYVEEVEVDVIPKVTDITGLKDLTLTEGSTAELEPELIPKEFSSEKVVYKSDDSKTAKVSKDGKVTAVSEGTAVITVSTDGCKKKIKVKVEAKPVPVQQAVQPQRAYTSSGSGTKKKSSGTPKKKTGKKRKNSGYFDSSKDEYFN